MSSVTYSTHNDLLMKTLIDFYSRGDNLKRILKIITGETKISLRIVDWFATNYAKKNFTLYNVVDKDGNERRFKVYGDYKLKLKAYSKKNFDPFCRWDRISIPYENGMHIETTIGQLNFFKWTLENNIIQYIEDHYQDIENDMNKRNSTSKRKNANNSNKSDKTDDTTKTRKKREELSISASKSIKKEDVEIVVKFN